MICFVTPWRAYRMGGGFYADVTPESLPEDVWIDWMGRMAKKGGDVAANAIDAKLPANQRPLIEK